MVHKQYMTKHPANQIKLHIPTQQTQEIQVLVHNLYRTPITQKYTIQTLVLPL